MLLAFVEPGIIVGVLVTFGIGVMLAAGVVIWLARRSAAGSKEMNGSPPPTFAFSYVTISGPLTFLLGSLWAISHGLRRH